MSCSRKIEEMISDNRDKLIIDIGDYNEFAKGSYPGAVNYPWEEFESHIDELRRDVPVYLICYSGKRSRLRTSSTTSSWWTRTKASSGSPERELIIPAPLRCM